MARASNYEDAVRLAEEAADRASRRQRQIRDHEARRRALRDWENRPRWFRPWYRGGRPKYDIPLDTFTTIECSRDLTWRRAVADNQWFMQQATMYGVRQVTE